MKEDIDPVSRRGGERGVVLLTTLICVLLLATLTAIVQAQEQANVKTMAKLAKATRDQVTEDSVRERMRGLIALTMSSEAPPPGAPSFDSTPLVVTEGGREWQVRVQDVEGLVDLYLAPPEVLALLPLDVAAFVAAREKVRRDLGPSERFPTLESSLARMGATGAEILALTTQSSQTGALRKRVLVEGLQDAAKNIPAGIRENEPTVSVAVWVQ